MSKLLHFLNQQHLFTTRLRATAVIAFVVVIACLPMYTAPANTSNANQTLNQRSDFNLPDLGDSSEQVLSYRDQRSIGINIIKQLFDAGLLLEDPIALDYIQTLGEQVAAGIPRNAIERQHSVRAPVQFYIIDDDQINAFALPGGFVVINRGLMLAAENEAELAGVLAHELAHVEQLHIARSLEKSRKLDVLLAGAVLAALIFGGGDPAALQAALSIGLAGSAQGRINFTRQHEYEADRVGIAYLHNAGFDPQGMVNFFARLHEKDRYYTNDVPEILRTHPVSSQRILEARQRTEQMQPGFRGSGSERFYLARERLRILSSSNLHETLALYKNQAALPELPSVASRYATALAQSKLNQYAPAIQTLTQLNQDADWHIEYPLALASALHSNRQSQQAIDVLQQAHRQTADHPAIALAHARILFDQKNYTAVKSRLLSSLSAQKEALSWRILADVAAQQGRNGEAHLNMSEYYLLHHEVREALLQLELGAKRQDNTPREQQQIEARLDEIRDAVGDNHQSRHWQSSPN